jgi:hypothetical protein
VGRDVRAEQAAAFRLPGQGVIEGPWSWATSRTLRKTVATRLDEAGFTPGRLPTSWATPTRR